MSDTPARPRRRLKRILATLPILLILLGLAGVLVHDYWGQRRMNALIAAAAKKGPVTFEQIEAARRVWADEENGALVLQEIEDDLTSSLRPAAAEVITDEKGLVVFELPAWVSADVARDAIEFEPWNKALNFQVTQEPGHPVRFRITADQAYQHIVWKERGSETPIPGFEPGPLVGQSWDEETFAQVRRHLNHRRHLLDALAPLRGYRGGRFPFDVTGDPVLTPLPGPGMVRAASNLTMLRAWERLMSGEAGGIVDDVDLQLTLANLMADEPMLISQLVRVALLSRAVDLIQHGCGTNELTDEQLHELTQRVRGMDRGDRLHWGMLGERAMMIGSARWLRGETPKPVPNPPDSGWGTADKLFYRGRIAWNVDAAWALQSYRISYAQNSEANLAAVHQAANADDSWLEAPYYHFALKFIPIHERAFQFDVNLTAYARCSLAALAAEKYRLRTGAFPEALDQLVPEYLDAVPVDPFDAKPLRYLREPDRVVIYSIGIDEADNHAQLDPQRKVSGGLDTGFILLSPEYRNRPAAMPASAPSAASVPAAPGM